MSHRYFETRRESGHIPSGRQLPRTPPLTDVRRHLSFSIKDPLKACEMVKTGSRGPNDSELKRTFDFHTLDPKTELSDHTMLKDMKGYQLTPSDLEFIRTMQEDKLIRKFQRDLEEVKKLLKAETMAAEMSLALRERAQAELDKLPSWAELTHWATAVLAKTHPSADLDTECLLSMVKKEDIQRVMEEEEAELARLEEVVEDKRKKETEQREQLEKQIVEGQLKLRELMSELSKLKSELVQQQEVQSTLQSQIKEMAEIKAEVEKVEIWERGVGKSLAKRGGKERKTAAQPKVDAERNQPQRTGVASTKSNKQSGAKEANGRARTKTNTAKASGAAKKAQTKEPTKDEPLQTNPSPKQSRGGRGQPPTVAPQLRKRVIKAAEGSSGKGQTAAESKEEASKTSLRRSKRIANRK